MTTKETIENKLSEALSPTYLDVLNESYMHNVPEGSESHFNVTIVCEAFGAMRKVARHQKVYGILAEEMAGSVHALALHTYDQAEWDAIKQQSPKSPDCKGG